MKCDGCKHEWRYAPDWTSPYGEWSCMHEKYGGDLYGCSEEDVENCEGFEEGENLDCQMLKEFVGQKTYGSIPLEPVFTHSFTQERFDEFIKQLKSK